MGKIKYEKPVSLNAGEVASVLGQLCANGSSPTEGCVDGFDPNVQPVCEPSGLGSTGNCKVGDHAFEGCSVGTSANWGCFAGNTP